jgi:hypothetical protein
LVFEDLPAFVREDYGEAPRREAKRADWSGLCTMRDLRHQVLRA